MQISPTTTRILAASRSGMPIMTPRPATVEPPQKKSADESVAGAKSEPSALKRNCNERGKFHREKNTGEDGDRGIEKKARREAIAEKEKRPQRRDHRLDIQNDVNNSWISVFEREREKDRADRRAGETGKEQIAPRRDFDLAKLAEIRQEERQKH